MELLKKDHQEKELSSAVKILFLLSLCISSCSIIKSKVDDHKVQGGYESISYMKDNASDDSVHICGVVTEAKTNKRVPDAEIIFLDFGGNIVKKIFTDNRGVFETKLNKSSKFGSIEIDGNNFGFLKISDVDFGIFVNDTKIKARLFRYDHSITESDFSKKEDRNLLEQEILEMKKKK